MLLLKSTVSVLALTMAFSFQNAFSMDDDLRQVTPSKSPSSASSSTGLTQSSYSYTQETLHQGSARPVSITKDTYKDSASQTFSKATSATAPAENELVRILSCVGGGVRGLFTAIEFSVFEEILNDPLNAELQKTIRAQIKTKNPEDYATRQGKFKTEDFPLYIRDIFDVCGGTSTGSILTAGLFSHKHYTAIELAKIYARYGDKIFGKQKNNTIGLRAFYDRSGLDKILTDHFKGATIQDVYKPIYIFSVDQTNDETIQFSSDTGMKRLNETTSIAQPMQVYIRKAVGCSSSAPFFFDYAPYETPKGPILKLTDGGTVANNPSDLLLAKERIKAGDTFKTFELYTFGTGDEPPTAYGVLPGAADIMNTFIKTLTQNEKNAFARCCDEVKDPKSSLVYHAFINPKVEPGMAKLDDTTSSYNNYMIRKALSVTKGQAFAEMMSRLGLKIPDLNRIHQVVNQKLNSLSATTYSALNSYEKEFVIKKILDLDFMFYANRYHLDPITGKVTQIPKDRAQAFLGEVQEDIKQRKAANDGWLSYAWSFVTSDPHANVLEFIPRAIQFHTVSYKKDPLTKEGFECLKLGQAHFTQDQLRKLSPKYKINGDGFVYSGSQESETEKNKLAFSILNDFVTYCDGIKFEETGKSKYAAHNSPYIDVVALIFWKNKFQNIEGMLTKANLTQLKNALTQSLPEIAISRGWTLFAGTTVGSTARNTRYSVLVQALDTYIKKFYNGEPVVEQTNTATAVTAASASTSSTQAIVTISAPTNTSGAAPNISTETPKSDKN